MELTLELGQIIGILGIAGAGYAVWQRVKDRLTKIEARVESIVNEVGRHERRIWNGDGIAPRLNRVEQQLARLKGRGDRHGFQGDHESD